MGSPEVKGSRLHGQEAYLPLSPGNTNSELCSIRSLSSMFLHSCSIQQKHWYIASGRNKKMRSQAPYNSNFGWHSLLLLLSFVSTAYILFISSPKRNQLLKNIQKLARQELRCKGWHTSDFSTGDAIPTSSGL